MNSELKEKVLAWRMDLIASASDVLSEPIDIGDQWPQLACELNRLEDDIRRVAERFGVPDPGAANMVALLIDMEAAVYGKQDIDGIA